MFNQQDINQILFFDIETARLTKSYSELPEGLQRMWKHKTQIIDKDLEADEVYYDKAGIFAEFAKVVVISFGLVQWRENQAYLRVKSFYGADEATVLAEFKDLLDNKLTKNKYPRLSLCAHNGKEFDIPFLCRRFLINQIALPEILNIQGKKPWEVNHLDTMELWKFGDRKSYTKLELLCEVFAVPSPKGDIDGSQVGEVFWQENDVERIAQYCEQDVIATARLFLKYNLFPLLPDENIEFTTEFEKQES